MCACERNLITQITRNTVEKGFISEVALQSVYAGSIPTRASIFTSFSLNTSIGCRMTVLILSLTLSHQVFLHIPDSF